MNSFLNKVKDNIIKHKSLDPPNGSCKALNQEMEFFNWKVLLYVPNIIGYARILLALTSFVLLGLQLPGWFVLVYTAAIILDGMDGYFARKLGQCSQFGAWLASIVSALEWTVFVCNHQLGDDWRLRVAEGATKPPAVNPEGASSDNGGDVKTLIANGTKSNNEFSIDMLTAMAAKRCDQNKQKCRIYEEVCEEEYERCPKQNFTEDCKENFLLRDIVTHQEPSNFIASEASIPDSRPYCKGEREDHLKSQRSPHLVQWIMKNNFRSVGGVWAIAGLHVLPLWLVGLRHGVFTTSLHFLPTPLPVLGVLVLGAGRLLCGLVELWCIWLHVRALITASGVKSI